MKVVGETGRTDFHILLFLPQGGGMEVYTQLSELLNLLL